MRNERNQEELKRYFSQSQGQNLQNSRRSQEETQWFPQQEEEEDMKIAPSFSDDGTEEDDFLKEPPRKKKHRQSKLSRFAESFLLICIFVGVAVFLAYFALVSASDLLGLGQQDKQIEVTSLAG